MSGLNGKHIITTCASEKADRLHKLLGSKGATVHNYPMIKTKPIDSKQLDTEELINAEHYNWIIFTSANGVKYFFFWLEKLNINTNALTLKYAVIGSATHNELLKYKLIADFIGKSKDSKDFAKEFSDYINKNQKILWVTGNLAMNNINNVLNKNHQAKKLVIYETLIINEPDQKLIDAINSNNNVIGIFLSPSSVKGFYNATNNKVNYEQIKFIPIGKTTANTINKYHQNPLFIPSMPNIDTLVNELNNYYN